MTRISLISAIALLVLSACSALGHTDPSEVLFQAQTAINEGQWDAAQRILDNDLGDASSLSASQLGEVSIMYMRLAENAKEDENVASATQYYLKAFACQADSALQYYSSLPLEQSQYVVMLSSLSRSITSPPQLTGDTLIEEECDSLLIQDEHCNHSH